jgi:cell division protein FtsZ
VMSEMGKAMMGTGEAEGENRAIAAAEKAIANPLLDGVSMKGAKGVIVSIVGGEDMRLMEVDEAASHIKELVDPDANIIWGSAFNPALEGKIRVSVVATGIEAVAGAMPEPARVFSFPTAKKSEEAKPAPAPRYVASVVEAPEPVVEAAPSVEAIEEPLVLEAPEPVAEVEVAPVAQQSVIESVTFVDAAAEVAPVEAATAEDSDELLLSPMVIVDDAVASNPIPPVATFSDDDQSGRRRWMVSGEAEEEKPAPRIAGSGGTLFERMSNIARNVAKADQDGSQDPLDIPRFLNRQNNQ